VPDTWVYMLRCRDGSLYTGWTSDLDIDAILDTVARPDLHVLDPTGHRERFYRQHPYPGGWLRVVVDFSEEPAWIVTAVVQDNDPRG
jgi:hypothetical protein